MKGLTYEQTYERIKNTLNEVTEELEAIESIRDLCSYISDEIDSLESEINESFDSEQIEQIMYMIIEESTEIDENLESWLENCENGFNPTLGLNFEQIEDYLDFIKDKDDKEKAIILLKNLIDGPEIEQYRNFKTFIDFLQQEFNEDTENSPEILQIKRRELLYLINENNIDLRPTDIFHLQNNQKVDANQHALYLGFKAASEDILPDDFEKFYRRVMKEITNPYTKIGMNMLYLSKTEEFMLENPNYSPSSDLINEAIPYLALKISLDHVDTTSLMEGEASNTILAKTNIWDGIWFVNSYIDTKGLDREIYNLLLDVIDRDIVKPEYIDLIQKLLQGKNREVINAIRNNILNDFIKEQIQDENNSEISVAKFIALAIESTGISPKNFKDYAEELLTKLEKADKLTREEMADICSLMFYIERMPNTTPNIKNKLREATTNWLNYYIDGTSLDDLRTNFEDVCIETAELEITETTKNLTDEEIEKKMFNMSQDFYKEYVAAYILKNISKRAEKQIYDNKRRFTEDGFNADDFLQACDIVHNNEQAIESIIPLVDKDKQDWIRKLFTSKENIASRDINYRKIMLYILTIQNPEHIKEAVNVLYDVLEGDVEAIYRNSASLINLFQKDLEESKKTLDSTSNAAKKIIVLDVMFWLPEDLKYIDENENTLYHTTLRKDKEIAEHGKMFALRELADSMSLEQFEKFYNKTYCETSSDNIKTALELIYVYTMEKFALEDENFSPDFAKLEGKLPILLAKEYLQREMPVQMYQHGAFTSAFKEDVPSSIENTVMSNYLTDCNMTDDFFVTVANRCRENTTSQDGIKCFKGLGTLKEKGQNGEFYKKYIKEYCGEFIERQRENLFPNDPANQEENEKQAPLSKIYMAMMLNSSQYEDINNNAMALKEIKARINSDMVTSNTLFDIGSYLMHIEKRILTKVQLDVTNILSNLGENWMECYLDAGKLPEDMKTNLAKLLTILEKEQQHEER